MQKAIHILSGAEVFSFDIEANEKKALIKAGKNGLLVCPVCEKPVYFEKDEIDFFKHMKPNAECELSLTNIKRELKIEKAQAMIYSQLKEIYITEDIELDIWMKNKRYHLVGPNFRMRIFTEINPYNYINDKDINVYLTEYQGVFEAETLKNRSTFYGFNSEKKFFIMYNFHDAQHPITYCPLDNFYINEKGNVYKKNFIAKKGES